ncbi:peptidoglycan-binding domain-containing protein [Streptomyces sp. NPDC051051]|uniref:peptidoglycan-binding domain-containing protein n=1 Tax=Streptomyces sp. NPDC051051 TaxID=3155666 RepID=UPI00344A92F2
MNDPTDGQGRPGEPVHPQGHGHPCPRCGALRAADNTPSCACARQASDALRDTREAEAAAAEDFDPLRIRPYVELGQGTGSGAGSDAGPGGGPGDGEAAAGDATMPLPTAAVSDATMPLRAVPPSATAPVPTPLAPPGSAPSDTDLSLFEAGGEAGGGPYDDGAPRGRRRRTLLIASTGAAVAVIAAAGFASGMFSYEPPARNQAAPEGVRAAVPDTSTSAPPASPSASRSASPSASSASPSPSESASASPSATESSASPSPSRTTEPSPSPSASQATPSLAPGNGADGDGDEATVLRRGDRGPEVTELQLRLGQVYLYNDEANGVFSGRVEDALRNYQWSRGIQGDELGTYGATTRARLESETKEP